MCNIFAVFYLKYWIIFLEEFSKEDGNASQSSDYYYEARNENMTADLAISGNDNDMFANGACSVTQTKPPLTVAWWMFTFPVYTVYITTVNIHYRENSKCSYQLIWLF